MSKTIAAKTTGKDEVNEKLAVTLIDKLPEHVSRMWELPQIYEFLCFAKDTLHIENLSMYEMERMLLIPKASKQLANIMTSLLSSSMPRSRLLKIPPMPYEFWTNVLLKHKVNIWLKVYESKEYDSVKVLDAIGIEPDFWTIFPDVAAITQCDFEELNIRQRVWLLKTVCDTMMHGKKSLQDEVANRYLDGEGEKILGKDRYGARYVYFPIFLDNDIRIYKHNLNNKILLNATPIAPKSKIYTRRVYNQRDKRRKKSRWKNGELPQRQKKRRITTIQMKNNQPKCKTKIETLGKTTLPQITRSKVDLNLSVDFEGDDEKELARVEKKEVSKIKKEKEEEMKLCKDQKIEGYKREDEKAEKEENDDIEVVNLYLASKSSEVEKSDGQPHPDDASSSSKTDDEKINEIKTVANGGSNSVLCSSKVNNGEISKSDDEKLIDTKTLLENNDNNEKLINNNENLNDKTSLNSWMKALLDINNCKKDIKNFHDENSHDSFMENSDCIRTRSKTICKREMKNFNNILMDLGVSTFELVADSVESLRELVKTLSTQNSTYTNNEPVKCELLLIKKLKALVASLKPKESLLKASTENARLKLEYEWKNFRDGISNNDASNGARHASKWVLGSQGCPLLSCSETLQHDANDNEHMESENEDDADEKEDDRTKGKTETRRVLRARGVSSYMEQFSSDDDTDASHPEGWAEIVDPATGIHLGSSVQADGGTEDDEESEGSGSDQDWILPGERKRKSKRMFTGRRLRSFQNKPQNIDVDIRSTESTSSLDIDNTPKRIFPKSACDKIKIESVHSEFHIEDEAQAIEPSPINNKAIVSDNNVQQTYVLHQVVNTPNGPMNYVVVPNNNSSIAQSSQIVSVMPQIPMQSTYYMQNPRGYLVPNPQVTQVRPSFVNQQNLPSMHGVLIQPNHQPYVTSPHNYIQYQQLRMVPPVSIFPTAVQQPIVTQPMRASTPLMKMPPRIVQNRQIVPPYRPRHPVGAVIRSTIPFRAETRLPNSNKGRNNKTIAPRNPTAPRNVRPTKANVKVSNANNVPKTTSLIVLSDSDDEIEMIIPEKKNESKQEQKKPKKALTSQHKIVDSNKSVIAPTTDNDNQCSSQGVLTSQIIQRMSQGGISITPIKPKASTPSSTISTTQLVVVVNETGSHYALALPNGSKLILTPEQVAQIRASNGGKLVL